jgi:hypothetical protein
MTRRHNGEGSIYPHRNGFTAHVWITTPEGRRQRKVVCGKTREHVHERWLALHDVARRGPVAPGSPTLADFMQRWLGRWSFRTWFQPPRPTTTCSAGSAVPDLGRIRLDKLTVRDVQTWLGSDLVATTGYGTAIDPRNFRRFFHAWGGQGRHPCHRGARGERARRCSRPWTSTRGWR